LQRPFKA